MRDEREGRGGDESGAIERATRERRREGER